MQDLNEAAEKHYQSDEHIKLLGVFDKTGAVYTYFRGLSESGRNRTHAFSPNSTWYNCWAEFYIAAAEILKGK